MEPAGAPKLGTCGETGCPMPAGAGGWVGWYMGWMPVCERLAGVAGAPSGVAMERPPAEGAGAAVGKAPVPIGAVGCGMGCPIGAVGCPIGCPMGCPIGCPMG